MIAKLADLLRGLMNEVFIAAIVLALASVHAYAEERPLDLSLPKDVLAPAPIYIVIPSNPNTPSAVRMYASSVLQQIDAEFKSTPTLDKSGLPVCTDLTIDALVVLDKTGRVVDIRFKHESTQGRPDLRNEVEENLLRAAQRRSPFLSFPEADRLGTRLVGIPAKMVVQCNRKRVWRRASD